jgi:hypothetical protein
MAKKSETKKNKKQAKKSETKKVVDTSFKDAFMADAKNTAFTEETVKELDEVKVEPTDNEPVEETNEIEVINATEEQEDTTLDVTDSEHEHWDIYATGSENEEPAEEEAVTEAEPTEEVLQVPFVQTVVEEEPESNTVGETVSYTQTEVEEEPQPKKEEIKPKKKRSTSKEVYGYHWMGLIYDE